MGELGRSFRGKIVFTDHHESHAASAFFPSPFDEAAIMTLDGVGEWSTSCLGVGRGRSIELFNELRFPHSLGLLYSAFTYYTGFKVNSGEYKVMGLAPYGTPKFVDLIFDRLIDLKPDGSYRLDMRYFNYCQGLTMTSKAFDELFGGPPRDPESRLTQREMDLAASLQVVTEEVMMRTAMMLHARTGVDNLVMAGGVALNCVGNGKILKNGPFKNMWIQPAAGDAGGSLGAATFIWHQLLERPRRVPESGDFQSGSFLGPAFTDEQVRSFLDEVGAVYETIADDARLAETTAELLAQEKVVGWFQGRMEFGPRALGARSILGDARSETMQSTMNLKIKFRESFRPFAPMALRERVADYFDVRHNEDSPYMLQVASLLEKHRLAPGEGYESAFGIDKLHFRRSTLPAITHVDHSARIQTIDAERNPLMHRVLSAFERKTGCPVIINTSFNIRSEPIVCTPADAYMCFMMTDIDVLAMGRLLLRKENQRIQFDEAARNRHMARFTPD
jgi:carbamoyltransferase